MVNRNATSRDADTAPSAPYLSIVPPVDVTPLIEATRPTLAAVAEVNDRLYKTVAAFNTECMNFLNRRLKEDMAVPQQFAACRTMEDVYGVYSGFFQRAAEQYQAEREQLAKISQTAAQDTLQQAQDQTGKARREMR